jgi:hypothetical protein
MNEPKSPAQAIKIHVNKFGELHLNCEMTAILLQWVSSQENHLNEAIEGMEELLKLLQPLLSFEQFNDLEGMFKHLGELTRR